MPKEFGVTYDTSQGDRNEIQWDLESGEGISCFVSYLEKQKQKKGEFKGKAQGQSLAVFTHDFQGRDRQLDGQRETRHYQGAPCMRQGGIHRSTQDLRLARFLTANTTDTGLFQGRSGWRGGMLY